MVKPTCSTWANKAEWVWMKSKPRPRTRLLTNLHTINIYGTKLSPLYLNTKVKDFVSWPVWPGLVKWSRVVLVVRVLALTWRVVALSVWERERERERERELCVCERERERGGLGAYKNVWKRNNEHIRELSVFGCSRSYWRLYFIWDIYFLFTHWFFIIIFSSLLHTWLPVSLS